jgi:hypothetical protein
VEQPNPDMGDAGGASVRSNTTMYQVSGIVHGDMNADSDGRS